MSNSTLDKNRIKIAWIGTGVMGFWMCSHIMDAGYKMTVYNRTKSKSDKLVEKGAIWAESPADAAVDADIIFTMVGSPADVREVYFGEKGIFKGCSAGDSSRGKYFVDMTTTEPSLAAEIYKKAEDAGCHSLDAPVSGGDVGAREARLSIMAGGEKKDFEFIKPLFEIMGKTIIHEGGAGSGQHTKMCNQITVAGGMIGICEALVYGRKAGLDLELMLSTIRGGAAASWSLDNYGPRILKGDFAPGFMVDHFIKDMGIALEEAKRMGLYLPGLALANQLYSTLKAMGHGQSGTHSLIHAIDKLTDKSLPG
jgi:3-hydroxyisobutyrate dehydrogenase